MNMALISCNQMKTSLTLMSRLVFINLSKVVQKHKTIKMKCCAPVCTKHYNHSWCMAALSPTESLYKDIPNTMIRILKYKTGSYVRLQTWSTIYYGISKGVMLQWLVAIGYPQGVLSPCFHILLFCDLVRSKLFQLFIITKIMYKYYTSVHILF